METFKEFFGRNKARVIWTALLLLHIGFIYHNSLTPAVVSSQQSGTVLAMARSILAGIGLPEAWLTEHIVRKTAHFVEYALLGFLLWNSLRCYRPVRMFWMALEAWLTVLVPLVDETLQLVTEGRSGQVDDVWLDISGVCFGTLCAFIVWKLWKRRKNRGRKSRGRK